MGFKEIAGQSGDDVKPREMPETDTIRESMRQGPKPTREPGVRITVEVPQIYMDKVNQIIAKRQKGQIRKITWGAFIRDCIRDVLEREQSESKETAADGLQ